MNKDVKHYLGIAAVASLVLISVSVVGYVWSYSKSVQTVYYRSFAVSAEGKAAAVPDVAKFTMSVITQGGKNLGALQTENISKTNKAVEYIKSASVEAKDIKTESYNVEPRYQSYSCPRDGGVCPPAEIVGYAITQTVSVKVRDFGKIGDLLSGVVSNGANSVSQLSFEVDDPYVLEKKAREEALAKARAKALNTAKAGGFRLGKLISVEEGGYPIPLYYGKVAGMGGDIERGVEQTPVIEPGSSEVKVAVVLRYEIR